MHDVIQQWEEGNITDMQAIKALVNELGEVEDELKSYERQKEETRNLLTRIIQRTGKVEIRGYGSIMMTQPSTTSRYDTKALDNLVLELMQTEWEDMAIPMQIAAKIAECRRETTKGAFLRIERER